MLHLFRPSRYSYARCGGLWFLSPGLAMTLLLIVAGVVELEYTRRWGQQWPPPSRAVLRSVEQGVPLESVAFIRSPLSSARFHDVLGFARSRAARPLTASEAESLGEPFDLPRWLLDASRSDPRINQPAQPSELRVASLGFPFRCVTQSVWGFRAALVEPPEFRSWNPVTPPIAVHYAQSWTGAAHSFPATSGLMLTSGYWLAMRPHPAALIANTLLWSTLSIPLFNALVASRNRRLSKNLCPHCTYPLTGLPTSSPCPECGQTIAQRTLSSTPCSAAGDPNAVSSDP